MLDQTIGDFNELKTQFLIFSILYFNKGLGQNNQILFTVQIFNLFNVC